MLGIRVQGLDDLNATIDAGGKWAKGPFTATAAPRLRESYNQHAGEQFDSKGRHLGTPWKPLAASTQRYKARRWPSRPLMIRTTKLVKSMADKNSPHAIYRRSSRVLTMGTRVPYARYHQSGGGKLPKRPLFVITKEVADEWTTILRDDLTMRLR